MFPFIKRSRTMSVVALTRGTRLEDRRRYSADSDTLHSSRKARRSRQRRQSSIQQIRTRDYETPYQKFRRVSKTVRVITTIGLALKSYVKVAETKLWSLVEMQLNMLADMENSLAFDRSMFAKLRIDKGSEKLKSILTKKPERRQKEEIETVVALLRCNKTFGNYTKETQISLAKVMHFVTYEYRRIILKEGHQASGFYIILSGTCLVNQRETDQRTGTTFVRTVAEISNGDAFGGHELLNDTTRGASYVCKDSVELLLVDKENFQKIIREPLEKDRDELIDFCKSQEIFWGLPVDELRTNHIGLTCAYYRPETVVLHNIREAGHIAIIKSGKCKVIAELVESTKRPNQYGRIPVGKCSGGREDWKATAALRKSMTIFQKANKATMVEVPYDRIFNKRTSIFDDVEERLTRSSSFDKFGRDDIQKIFIQSPKQLNCCNKDQLHNLDGIQRTWKRLGLTASSITAKEVQNNPLEYKTDKPMEQGKDYKSTYAQIAELGAGSVFGLETILRKTNNNLSLVSQGADCILVSKRFFQNESNMKMLETTNTMAIDFPQTKETFTKIREGRAWVSFKDTLVKEILEGKSKKVMGIIKK